MRPFAITFAVTFALAGAVGAAQSSQPGNCIPSKADMEAVKFGYAVKNLPIHSRSSFQFS